MIEYKRLDSCPKCQGELKRILNNELGLVVIQCKNCNYNKYL